eukprot:CAMPEP_0174718570 /NCGR_PEP_ID=MMETSP1094-20130205/29363_1 /TAXON_ID=156173 /ORGANISM="Chrysochromulina brevifilum, Strain UTEX LB 985" /LENGTH=348 /DNA_ID=CAMNT_0015918707 /DNA_START=195 /DNA_END=1242 /DNA_ORIENTATION=-
MATAIAGDGPGVLLPIAGGGNELLQQLYDRLSGPRAKARGFWGEDHLTLTAQMVSAFEGAHDTLRTFNPHGLEEMPGQESGACGVALVLRKGKAILAHTGDCRAVMGTLDEHGKYTALALTEDHKLETPNERERIEATGAYIKPASVQDGVFRPARVYVQEEDHRSLGPGLTMSRSLGDTDADPLGVISTPEVSFRTLEAGKDKFIVLASDGVWEFLSNDMVVESVGQFYHRGAPAIQAARFLIAKAASRWKVEEGDYRDDITAIVIYLDGLPDELGTAPPRTVMPRSHTFHSVAIPVGSPLISPSTSFHVPSSFSCPKEIEGVSVPLSFPLSVPIGHAIGAPKLAAG